MGRVALGNSLKNMAQRRMFSKSITNSSNFLMMPLSSQALYLHLGMNADDDGFCEHFGIMRMIEAKPDDLRVLQAKGFVDIFDEKVLIVRDWKENNYIRHDTYRPSKYLELYKKELKMISKNGVKMISSTSTDCPRDVDDTLTQDRIGKDRIGKDRKDNTSEPSSREIPLLIDSFKIVNPSYKKMFSNKSQRDACYRLIEIHGLDKLLKIVAFLPKSNITEFMPVITTPCQLEDKFGQLAVAWQKLKNKQEIIL